MYNTPPTFYFPLLVTWEISDIGQYYFLNSELNNVVLLSKNLSMPSNINYWQKLYAILSIRRHPTFTTLSWNLFIRKSARLPHSNRHNPLGGAMMQT